MVLKRQGQSGKVQSTVLGVAGLCIVDGLVGRWEYVGIMWMKKRCGESKGSSSIEE